MRIFHIATVSDWEAARRSGSYTTSTYGVTLAQEGFIHASRGDQWQGVRERFYAGVTEPLVLLVVDTDKLSSPVVEEPPAPGMTETYPHVYGPLDVTAVVQTIALDADPRVAPDHGSFSRVFFAEMAFNLMLFVLVMVDVGIGAVLGGRLNDSWGPYAGVAVGLLISVPFAIGLQARRRTR